MRAIFLANGNIFTTGFSRMSERQLALWKTVRQPATRWFITYKRVVHIIWVSVSFPGSARM